MSNGTARGNSEPLLAASGVKLFGQLVVGLTLDLNAAGGSGASLKRLVDRLKMADPQLARIYGFSHDGQYFDVTPPAIFLVDGPGTVVGNHFSDTRVAATPPELAGDMLSWDLDRADFSLRIDIDVGPLDRILLDMELGPDPMGYGGANVRLQQAGANVRLQQAGANARLRYAGANVRSGGRGGGGLSD